ncbi:helix-turn-helix domain-containing protein [Persicobacter psychrovividus]|uniref:HTH tetR-type domain-containing protein n=1 Tax=Persicobacter psychrovividus TaxID=387638 RepID=A0ABM7VJK3_9BACT|nr:hypothetical protein PEPS_34220 [Persicobacter psychrovividus]
MKQQTKNNIIAAAREMILEEGYGALRMQALADRAEVNKGVIHYYFKGKENLYQEVLASLVGQIYVQVQDELMREAPLKERLESVVGLYLQKIAQEPRLPLFIVNELPKNPALLSKMPLLQEVRQTLNVLSEVLKQEGYQYGLKNAMALVMNMVSLIAFPFFMVSIKDKVLPDSPQAAEVLQDFMADRASEIASMVMVTLKQQSDE